MGLTMKEKKSLTRETCGRYRKSGKKGKSKILDEFCQATGYNRKYALHLLANWGKTEVLNVAGKMVKLKAGTAKRRGEETGLWAGSYCLPPPHLGVLLVPVREAPGSVSEGPDGLP